MNNETKNTGCRGDRLKSDSSRSMAKVGISEKKPKTRLGIYGGTFSPVHNGHVRAADNFFDLLCLDRLLIMPTFIPPHKQIDCPDEPYRRLEMLNLAFEGDPRNIEISDYEIKKEGKSYTVETLRHFKSPECDIIFLMGTDMLLSFDQWYKPDEICKLAALAHIRRKMLDEEEIGEVKNAILEYEKSFGADITELECEPFPVSSTEIRSMCAERRDIGEYVPEKVAEYIKTNHLYGR